MNHKNEVFNSQLSLEEILQDSIDFNHLNAFNNNFSTNSEAFKYFNNRIKLKNVIKNQLWNTTRLQPNNVSLLFNNTIINRHQ